LAESSKSVYDNPPVCKIGPHDPGGGVCWVRFSRLSGVHQDQIERRVELDGEPAVLPGEVRNHELQKTPPLLTKSQFRHVQINLNLQNVLVDGVGMIKLDVAVARAEVVDVSAKS
jgi:hypothetical protein